MCRMLHDNCHILCYDGSIEMSMAEIGLGTMIMLEV